MDKFRAFLRHKNIIFSGRRYGIVALSAMAQGLFCSLLIGTIIKTLGTQFGVQMFVDIGTYAMAVSGPAMAVAIGYALQAPPMVLFSLIANVPVFAELSLVEDYGAPVDSSGKGVTMPLKLLPTEMLRQALQKAIDKEDYEQASQLNDELKKREMKESNNRGFS